VPIGIGALFLVPLFVRESRASDLMRHFDTAGAVTVTASLMLLVYGLTQSTNLGWSSGRTIGVLIASAALMAAFIGIELRSRSPLVPLGFFRRRTPTGANIIGFGLGTMVFGMFFLLSLYMQQVLGFSALKTGVGYLAVALTAVVASGLAQALVTRLNVKPVLITGLSLLGAGLVYFTQVSVDGSYVADLLPGFLLIGVGLGFSFVPVSIAALAGITGRDAGLASGLINTSQQIGGALGLAILTTIATTHTDTLLKAGDDAPLAFTKGFSLAFWAGVAFAVISVVATVFALRREDLRAPQHAPEPAIEPAG
jgi:predicted MFS family arabinose efflux permease